MMSSGLRIYVRLMTALFVAMGLGLGAEAAKGSVDISSQVDRSEITIGDRIQYEIKIVYPADGRIDLPSVLGNLGSFEVKDYQASDPKPAGTLKIQTWHFDLSTFTVGKYMIPPQQVEYRHGQDTSAAIYYTQPIEINVVRTSPETVKDIADIAAPAEIKTPQPWLLYGLGGALALGLGLFFLIRYRSKLPAKSAEKSRLPPFEEAMEGIAKLKDMALIRQNRAREFCFAVSELLRRYVSRRYGTDALESTTSEFLELSRKLPITKAQKEWLAAFCESTDLVKFASAPLLESDAVQLLAKLEEFVRQTKPKEEEQKPAQPDGSGSAGSAGGAGSNAASAKLAAQAKKPPVKDDHFISGEHNRGPAKPGINGTTKGGGA